MATGHDFEIDLAHLDGYARVKLRGDLDYPTTIAHAEALQEVTDLRTRVVLDLADLRFIDSAGLRFLVGLTRHHDGPMRLENVPPIVRRLLRVSGVADIFEMDPE
jgi:anti-sigma B factor antagonist